MTAAKILEDVYMVVGMIPTIICDLCGIISASLAGLSALLYRLFALDRAMGVGASVM
jgi:hypothetical protein